MIVSFSGFRPFFRFLLQRYGNLCSRFALLVAEHSAPVCLEPTQSSDLDVRVILVLVLVLVLYALLDRCLKGTLLFNPIIDADPGRAPTSIWSTEEAGFVALVPASVVDQVETARGK